MPRPSRKKPGSAATTETEAAAPARALPARTLHDLTRIIQRAPGFGEVVAALKNGRSATIDGGWGSAAALAAAALALHAPRTLLIVMAHVADVDDFRDDLATFSGLTPEVFPAWDRLPRELQAVDEVFGRRMRALKRLAADEPTRVVVAPMQAMLQPVPGPETLARSSRRLAVGDSAPIEVLAAWLVDRGMVRAEVVEVPGEFSIRGGIVDVFPADFADPIRIEYFGDEIESIRPFDVETQRSLDRFNSIVITAPLDVSDRELAGWMHPASLLPTDSWVVLLEPDDLRSEGRAYLSRLDDRRGLSTVEETFARLIRFPTIAVSTLSAHSHETTCHLRIESIERFSGDLARVKAELESAAAGEDVMIACHNQAEAERLGEVFADLELARAGRLHLTLGRIRAGFHFVDASTLVIIFA